MRVFCAFMVFAILGTAAATSIAAPKVTVGSKKFTESVILGEMVTQLARATGAQVVHRSQLGGTRVLWNALLRGDIDVYPEYTGTLRGEILVHQHITNERELRSALGRYHILMSRPLGFNNTYAIGMLASRANALHIKTISDLAKHPKLVFGFGNEFMDRADGWPALKKRYKLPQRDVRGMDHDLAYRALVAGDIDVMDLYATDADIAYYHIKVLKDDLKLFPNYNAVLIYRSDLVRRAPKVVRAFSRLAGRIDETTMARLNAEVKIKKEPEARVAARFLHREFGLDTTVHEETTLHRLWRTTLEHLTLVGISLAGAILVAVPLGIAAYLFPGLGQVVLAAVGIIQTMPTLALLVFMIPLLGIGAVPAMAALFLYSLLPITRNVHAGLSGIDEPVRRSALALGLGTFDRLLRIELPLAAPMILAGIKTAAVINVGTATLGALIGAGGYGQPILTGIRLDDVGLILEGAIPAAVLALIVQYGFEWCEYLMTPRGLRRSGARGSAD